MESIISESVIGGLPASQKLETASEHPLKRRAERAGLDIERIEHVTSTRGINFESGTLYIADGPIAEPARIDIAHAENSALMGTDDARFEVPRGDWGYDIRIRDATDILISGIDFDQTAGHGARGRIWLAGDNCIVERLETIGLALEPGYDPDDPSGHDMTGPTFYLPATTPDARNHLRDAHVIDGGTMQSKHWGIGPIGVWMGPAHRGTLDIDGFTLIDCPSDGVYVTNCTGAVNVRNSTFRNNCTAAIRIANGVIENCEVSFDYTDTRLKNADNPGNSNSGIMVEAKQGVSNVEVRETSVHLINVASSRAALSVRNMTTSGLVRTVENCRLAVDNAGYGGQMAPDVRVDDGAECRLVEHTTMDGKADTGVCLWNSSGAPLESVANEFGYPPGRERERGRVR